MKSFSFRITLLLILVMLLSALLSDLLVSEYAFRAQLAQLGEKLSVIAQSLAITIPSDLVESVPLDSSGKDTAAYREISQKLRMINKITPSIEYIYILVPTAEKGMLQFVIDEHSGRRNRHVENAAPGEKYDASGFPALLRGFMFPSADRKLTVDKWGVFLSGYAPIRDVSGKSIAILGVDIAAQDVYDMKIQVALRAVLVLFISLILAILIGVTTGKRVTGPVRTLIKGAEKIAQGDLDQTITVNGDDEIAHLSATFNKMSVDLKDYIQKLNNATAERERYLKELEIAKRIQQSFLPDAVPKVDGYDISALSYFAEQVGGDFYDFVPLDGNKMGFVIGDVMGKGVPAALCMGLSRTLVRVSARKENTAKDAVAATNRMTSEYEKTDIFVTLFYSILDIGSKTLTYANAGHNPPVLLRSDGSVELLEKGSMPIGIAEELDVSEGFAQLGQGDLVLFYTDGVVETENEKGEWFGMEKFLGLLTGIRSASADDILEAIRLELFSFTGKRPQHDDITMMILKVL